MELHLDAAVLVDPQLLAGLPRDDRRLRPLDDRPGREPRGTERRDICVSAPVV
jgi:hypothetical protein